ncbi:hypothetical protein HBI59_096880 [Parastagonospora nodorum]|nr:hypothetical protein HBI59_096880 [Parastagonospora nodorum]
MKTTIVILVTIFTTLVSAVDERKPTGTIIIGLPLPKPSKPPAAPPPTDPDSTPGHFYACTNVDLMGTCQKFEDTTKTCHNFPAEYVGSISSIQPDRHQTCYFYDKADCGGEMDELIWPGSSNLRGRRFDNRAVSWTCNEN